GYIIILFVKFFKICERPNLKFHIRKLTAPTGLLLINFTMLYAISDSFAVRNLRSTHISFYFKFTAQAFHKNLQVELAHSGDGCLPGLGISFYLKSRIFLCKLDQSGCKLLGICL